MITCLVDLDGTITDPEAGIVTSFQHALTQLGIEPPTRESLRHIIGPPLRQAFPPYLGPDRDVEEAVRLYRARYGTTGLFEATLYDGMPEVLAALRALPARLFVCTAKPQVFAARILDHFGLTPLFAGIYGPELSGRFDDKGELIAHMIAVENLVPNETVMIGDRASDVHAAARNGIRTLGVAWGYGAPGELAQAGAALVLQAPAELPSAVRNLVRAGQVDRAAGPG
jgi:phosphoglycolate phosphatase